MHQIIIPKKFIDNRGYFTEVFRQDRLGISFVQENESYSSYGTVRGLHYQKGNFAQTKLVRVIHGSILDVIVNIKNGEKFQFILSAENRKQLLIPKGYAHGFSVLSDYAIVNYKCDQYYDPSSEGGIFPFDLNLNIRWQIPDDEVIISSKDLEWPML